MGERLEMMTIVFPWANSFCGTCQGFAWMGNKKNPWRGKKGGSEQAKYLMAHAHYEQEKAFSLHGLR